MVKFSQVNKKVKFSQVNKKLHSKTAMAVGFLLAEESGKVGAPVLNGNGCAAAVKYIEDRHDKADQPLERLDRQYKADQPLDGHQQSGSTAGPTLVYCRSSDSFLCI